MDAALKELGAMGDLPVAEHPAVLEQTNNRLGEILGEVESGDESSPA